MKALLLFLFLSEAAFAQTYPRYKWVQISGDNFLRVIERKATNGRDSVDETRFLYSTDTANFRQFLTGTLAEKRAQSVEAYELYEKLDAAADSIYAVLQDLNDGYGANEPQSLRVPKRPDTDFPERWGAILPKTGSLKVG
ncbi:MAG: hypothetical protein BWY09_03015 [Candidatus Hydrogenedentes bacterium ADurb.Bin179]|nr:MAG: hypothetical protein BWY09_03015 [Candidatus Hydrogenedentes bacterium ADurb.Bin179]